MPLRLSEEIPEDPPECTEDRARMEWKMMRENYRIAKQYDQLSRAAKLFVSVVFWIITSVTAVFAFVELFKIKSH